VRTSSFVHGLTTRRDDLEGFAVLTILEFLPVVFKALGIIQVLQLSSAHIGTRCGDSKTAVEVGACGLFMHMSHAPATHLHGCDRQAQGFDLSKAVAVTMHPGDAVIHCPLTVHGSGGNETDVVREGLTSH
jgi:hypothetical protein